MNYYYYLRRKVEKFTLNEIINLQHLSVSLLANFCFLSYLCISVLEVHLDRLGRLWST